MATVLFKGTAVHTTGNLPAKGSRAPDFVLTTGELKDVSLGDFAGKVKILNIVPSLDTGVCATSARRFEQETASLKDTVILTVSADLPFAQSRFCKAEQITHVLTLSEFRDRKFGQDYGVEFADGPLRGILSRSVVVLDRDNRVVYTEQVGETTQEPDYARALEAARQAAG